MVLILTYNAPVALASCLTAVVNQTALVDAILIIDNGDPDGLQVPETLMAVVHYRHLTENLGPAGGIAEGLVSCVELGAELVWVLEDDALPRPDCLEHLLSEQATRPHAVHLPVRVSPLGLEERYPCWSGPLIAAATIRMAGVPRPELFWWTEDTEYLQWRLPRLGIPLIFVESARVDHLESRRGPRLPPWKLYYQTRNIVFYRVYIQRLRHPLKLGRNVIYALAESRQSRRHFCMFWLGLRHGVSRKLGKLVEPST